MPKVNEKAVPASVFARKATPAIIRTIFELSAGGLSYKYIPEKLAEISGTSKVPSAAAVLDAMHRRNRFANRPDLYAQVDPRDAEAVKAKFFSKYDNKSDEPAGQESRTKLLHEALDARIVWDKARQRVLDAGISEGKLDAWIDITLDAQA